MEWKSYGKSYEPESVEVDIDFTDESLVVKLPKNEPKPIEKQIENIVKKEPEPKKKNDEPEKIFKNPNPEPKADPSKILSDLETPVPAPIPDVPSVSVEEFPIFPGCEIYDTRKERKNCMSKKIYKLIGKHFDTQLAEELNLSGVQKIYASFKVSHTGEIIFVNARAPHPELQKEAERVILKIPDITPGKMNGKAVNVLFSVPINFKVN